MLHKQIILCKSFLFSFKRDTHIQHGLCLDFPPSLTFTPASLKRHGHHHCHHHYHQHYNNSNVCVCLFVYGVCIFTCLWVSGCITGYHFSCPAYMLYVIIFIYQKILCANNYNIQRTVLYAICIFSLIHNSAWMYVTPSLDPIITLHYRLEKGEVHSAFGRCLSPWGTKVLLAQHKVETIIQVNQTQT